MTDNANILFATEVPPARPHTTLDPSNRPLRGEVSPYLHLKTIRERAKSLQREYLQQQVRHHAVKKSLEKVTHKSLIKRTEFLKVYGNKKAKFQGQGLLQGQKKQRQRFQRKSMQAVKRRKLQYELQHILRQNEQEDRIYQMQLMNRKNKQILQKQLELARQREQSYQLHDKVKKGNTEFVIRRRGMSTSITLRSKRNYLERVNQELSMIHHYESILGEVELFVNGESKGDDSTLGQTLDFANSLFLTSKQTIE